jgi:hypothetical protein
VIEDHAAHGIRQGEHLGGSHPGYAPNRTRILVTIAPVRLAIMDGVGSISCYPPARGDTQRNAELSIATSTKPIRRSTLRMVIASDVAGGGRVLKIHQYHVI